jgi:hypothetical protein
MSIVRHNCIDSGSPGARKLFYSNAPSRLACNSKFSFLTHVPEAMKAARLLQINIPKSAIRSIVLAACRLRAGPSLFKCVY